MATRGRKRRQARRAKRREQRKLRKNGPEKQYYGGSERAFESSQRDADRKTDSAADDYEAAKKTAKTEMSRLRKETDEADADYNAAKSQAQESRQGYQSSIAGIGTNAQQAIAMRNNALAQNDLNAAANTAINQNNQIAQQRLAQGIGLQNRAARGLAAGMGEGGALAMQQAIAQAGANAGDLTAQNNVTQAQLANDMRYGAAQQQVANALGVADANAGTQYDSGLQMANANSGLMQADQNIQQLTDARQQNLLGMRSGLAELGVSGALSNQGQQLGNQQVINTSQLGVDQQNAAGKYAAAQANSPLAKLSNVLTGIKTVKAIPKEGSAASGLFGIGK